MPKDPFKRKKEKKTLPRALLRVLGAETAPIRGGPEIFPLPHIRHAGRPVYAGVSSDRTNLSPFTKDYRGLALSCDFALFEARKGTIRRRKENYISIYAGGKILHSVSGGLQPAHGRAFRAPLAERSAVNRQVLGSISSGGAPGGSSVVEQWTVKCLGAAIHWSGVQISLPRRLHAWSSWL